MRQAWATRGNGRATGALAILTVNGVEIRKFPCLPALRQQPASHNTSTARILRLELTAAKVAIIARDG